MYVTVKKIADEFDLPLTKNDATFESRCASDVVAEAIKTCGGNMTYSEIKNLFVHPSKSQARREIEATLRIFSRWRCVAAPPKEGNPKYGEYWAFMTEQDALDIWDTISSGP